MSIKEFQEAVIAEGVYVLTEGEGSHNLEHLLATAHDTIVTFELEGAKCGISDLLPSIRECFDMENPSEAEQNLYSEVFYGRAKLKDYRLKYFATDPHMVWNECEGYFQSIAPEGFYFGTDEGEEMGWFKFEEVSEGE